jgi:beta-glucosidase
MSDEALYGYITKGRSRPLPAGLRLRYRSDRPSVVRVVRGRRIRTVRDGVATVTVAARYHGVARSARFVVRVR